MRKIINEINLIYKTSTKKGVDFCFSIEKQIHLLLLSLVFPAYWSWNKVQMLLILMQKSGIQLSCGQVSDERLHSIIKVHSYCL